MKKQAIILTSAILLTSVFSTSISGAVQAESQSSQTELSTSTSNLANQTAAVSDTNSNQLTDGFIEISSKTVTYSEVATGGSSVSGEKPLLITPYAVINDGGYNWKLANTYYGSSQTTNTISKYTAYLSVAIAAAYFSKIASVFATTTFNTFYTPPTTRYYTTKTYSDQDSACYYTKIVLYVYSDSARTKLLSTTTKQYKSYK